MTANCHYDPCKARADNARASGRNVMKIGFCAAVMAAGLLVPGAPAKAATYEVTTRADIVFAEHDGVKLLGDLYAPKGLDKALVALAGEEPLYSSEYRNDANAAVSSKVKAVVGIYGVYDMQAQYQHDLVSRPRDNITEKFLGAAPHTNRKVFFEASPINYATVDRNTTRFLLVHGTDDDIVDPPT